MSALIFALSLQLATAGAAAGAALVALASWLISRRRARPARAVLLDPAARTWRRAEVRRR